MANCRSGGLHESTESTRTLELDFVQLTPDGRGIGLEVKGLADDAAGRLASAERSVDDWAEILTLHVDSKTASTRELPPIAGTYTIVEGRLRFVPRFPLTPGLSYRAVLHVVALNEAIAKEDPSEGSASKWRQRTVEARFHVPAPDRAVPTRVAHVYPTASVLPENLLKFYVYFSAPMSQGWAYRHIRLVEVGGDPAQPGRRSTVADPFLELAEELWDADGQRLTILLDPARVKRELKPREEVGPALLEDREYRLVIDREWRDANGYRLATTFEKAFKVAAPDYDALETGSWRVTAPRAGGRGPLLVEFPEPVDHALAQRLIWLNDSRGEPVPGRPSVAEGERVWRFVPTAAWRTGDYELVADSNLEDLAGNGIGRPFEVDIIHPPEKRARVHTIAVTVGERQPKD